MTLFDDYGDVIYKWWFSWRYFGVYDDVFLCLVTIMTLFVNGDIKELFSDERSLWLMIMMTFFCD